MNTYHICIKVETEVLIYPWQSLLAEFGGALGLFLGFSNGAPRDDKQISPYILDGTCSNVGSQPWMAQIQLKYAASEDNHHCGGKFNDKF